MMLARIYMMLMFAISLDVHAIREPRATAGDSRLRVMVYNPNVVFKYVGYYGYQGSIEFEEGEDIATISMGDTGLWQMIPSGNRLFLKPTADDATTNMTLITNKRLYFFELHASKASSIDDEGLAFAVKFIYPEVNVVSQNNETSSVIPSLHDLSKYNFKYSISGSSIITPVKIFDDGRFTFFEFRDKNAAVPAFFSVDDDGHEAIINYQVAGDYIVVERVESRFTLRHGKAVVCVFNESDHYPGLGSKKK